MSGLTRDYKEVFNRANGEPSSARWQYWSQMRDVSFCFEKKIVCQKSKHAAFHPEPVLPPSGEGSPLRNIVSGYC